MSLNRKTLMILAGLAVLMSLAACTREITTVEEVQAGASNCFNCHTDQDATLTDAQVEWANSTHASGNTIARGSSSSCSPCHSGTGFVAYLNGEEEVPNPTTIGCFSCHSPHSSSDFGLRINDAVPLMNGFTQDLGSSNLCISCHQSRRAVDEYVVAEGGVVEITSSHWGPHHSPQGDMLLGSNGFEFDGYTFESAAPLAHMSNACLTCHMDNGGGVDLGGHSFSMANLDDDLNVASCNVCHTDAEDFDIDGAMTEIDVLAEELHTLLMDAGFVDVDGHPIEDTTPTLAQAGALWNFLMWEEDQSHGVHNPNYITSLLEASIAEMTPVQ